MGKILSNKWLKIGLFSTLGLLFAGGSNETLYKETLQKILSPFKFLD